MATAYLYPNSDDSMTNPWPLSGPWYTLIDDVKGAYDDGTTYISNPGGASTTTMIFGMDQLSLYPVGTISNVIFEVRQRREITINPNAYLRISGTDYWNLTTTGGWITQNNSSGTNPHTAAAWTTNDLDNIQTKFQVVSGGAGFYANSTAMNLEVTYTPGGSCCFWHMALWLPPLLGLASHGLLKSEAMQIYRNVRKCKGHPSSDAEWKDLLWNLVRRPVYAY
jgi:hypothetical protein